MNVNHTLLSLKTVFASVVASEIATILNDYIDIITKVHAFLSKKGNDY